jgi:DNA-binding NtrC family response regulator
MTLTPVNFQKTIMVCDDEPDLLWLYSNAFKSKYAVIPVRSGKECLERYVQENNKGNKIHVLILDYRLGDMFGDHVACKIKTLDGTKVILVSAFDLDKAMIDNLKDRKCIADFIRKPTEIKTVRNIVEILMKD